MNIRMPAVAGRFYPASPSSLRRELEGLVPTTSEKRAVKGLVAPHAGYVYSGHVAGAVYAAVKIPERALILCPNHTGRGAPFAVQGEGAWKTPLGEAPIESSLARRLKEECPLLEEDETAHTREHSLEVQLPFLQYLVPGIRFVPVCVGSARLGSLLELGDSIARVLEGEPETLLVASSDMTHYESATAARKKDEKAVDRMKALDPEGLFRVVTENAISMCGYAPAVVVMQACRRLGAARGELVRYANSGDVSGDYAAVVGYAGIVFL